MQENNQQQDFIWFLDMFHKFIDGMPPKEKVKKQLTELRESANKSTALNLRQKEAILSRIDYYLTDNYGNTKQGITFKTA